MLVGRRIGGISLPATRTLEDVQDFVNRFYEENGAVFGSSAIPAGAISVGRMRRGPVTVVEVSQVVGGIPVSHARWTMIFDRQGFLTLVTGGPVDPAAATVSLRPTVDADEAIARALRHRSLQPAVANADADLRLDADVNRLVWSVAINGRVHPGLARTITVDAHSGAIVGDDDDVEHGVVSIPVTHYSHPGGANRSTSLTTSQINVDPLLSGPPLPGFPSLNVYALQRLGSGRGRIWNAQPTGIDATPVFTRTVSPDANHFTQTPGATVSRIFNEQQTYFWAQTLKTAIDGWGREPNDYGHYPVDPTRAVNVEIVVNGDSSMEGVWSSGSSVMHGYFRRNAPGAWFSSSASTLPAVFLFNSAGNSASPQFFGPEFTSSYAIVAHEVGHFVSWQYGSWEGANATLAGSLNEGHSMVLACLLGREKFGTALEYDESEYVSTGGNPGWRHYVYGQPPLKYSDLDCATEGTYELAWPFVHAMWRLMNNKDVNNQPIWGSADAAVSNTADLFMYSLFCFTSDTTMTWDKLCLALTARVYERVADGTEKDPINGYDAYCAVVTVFTEHGLLDECLNSP